MLNEKMQLLWSCRMVMMMLLLIKLLKIGCVVRLTGLCKCLFRDDDDDDGKTLMRGKIFLN